GNHKLFPSTAGATFFSALDLLQRVPTLLGKKIFLVHQFNPVLLREDFCTFAIYHDVSGFLHHQPGKADGIFDVLQRSDRAGGERLSVHDPCVHLVHARAREHRALACVKMRIAFEDAHSSLGSVEPRAATLENFVTSRQRTFQSGAIFAFSVRCHLASIDRSSTAVDREADSFCFHLWLILRAYFRCDWFLFQRRRRCTKEHESKEAISSETSRAFHRMNVMACSGHCRRLLREGMEGGAQRRLANVLCRCRARGARPPFAF